MKFENEHTSETSEIKVQIAQIFAKGTDVFDSPDSFKKWLETPNTSLDGAIPSKLIFSRYGAQMVLDSLGRIQYGVFS